MCGMGIGKDVGEEGGVRERIDARRVLGKVGKRWGREGEGKQQGNKGLTLPTNCGATGLLWWLLVSARGCVYRSASTVGVEDEETQVGIGFLE